ncbi:hypothetical protein [Deinococcus marmoris]|uniref:Uncharacterized protein n=1 Tax=Deinococcus marmoris TaxID=249408 RepID=A0A1U7NT57_9DEIO|nr:hypothetical protein [Deinococcus marmoris]OLV16108.1 hypothetical protein BOO71_0013003 [Deinococcus marmoris]
MILKFEKTDRAHVSSPERQQLRYQELAAILGEYGYLTAWNPGKYTHFSMRHVGSSQELRVRVSGRLLLRKDMLGGDHWLAFQDQDQWYLAPHDELVSAVHGVTSYQTSESWLSGGLHSFPGLSGGISAVLKPYVVKAGQ